MSKVVLDRPRSHRPSAVRLVVFALAFIFGGAACGSPGSVSAPVLERRDIHSVPQFLAALPDNFRSHFVLMFQSRSPQAASYEAPRAIVYGEGARRIIAFGGRSESIDVMSFDEDTNSFVLREVTFPDVLGQPSMRVSEPNPERCGICHGTPARPIWDTYPLWPGAYSESAEQPAPREEREGFATFERIRSTHPRYGYLVEHPETTREAAERRYHGASSLASNSEFGELLSRLNAKAIAGELRASPLFERYRYLLLTALDSRCGDVEELLPVEARTSSGGYASFAASSDRANTEQGEFKRWRAHTPPSRVVAADDPSMTRLRYIAETGLGIATSSWTLALEKGSYDFSASQRPSGRLERNLFAEIAGSDNRLLDQFMHGWDARALCTDLEQHQKSAFRHSGTSSAPGRLVAVASADSTSGGTLLGRCSSCHEHGVGPSIPFADPASLAKRLSLPTGAHDSLLDEIRFRFRPEAGAKHMPLGPNPSRNDQVEFLSYLVRLSTCSIAQ